MKTKFHKIYFVAIALLAFACTKDFIDEYEGMTAIVPESLKIEGASGIKLASTIVKDEVNINVKLPLEGTYKIKLIDFSGEMISSEKITAKEGDNILSVYVSALPVSSYKVQLLTENGELIGTEVFSMVE